MFIGSSGNSTGGFDNGTSIRLTGGGSIEIYDFTNSAYNFVLVTTSVYRDPSAWYHIVVAMDTTQATAANRIKLYVNGTQVTTFSTSTYPNQNTDWNVNNTTEHLVGAEKTDTSVNGYFDGYMAEVYLIDGQALTPSSFGFTDPNTGVWVPNAYNGSYGTNGFHLNFYNNTGTTSTTLGLDTSGNGNNWTPNNFSVTAGAGNDSLVDTPTPYGSDTGAGGEVRGNYCTLNPLDSLSQTTSNGNLQAAGSNDIAGITGTIGVSSGKWYWEVTAGSSSDVIGLWSTSSRVTSYPGATADSYCYFATTGAKFNNASSSVYGPTFTTNDIIGVALDMDAGTLAFYKNGVSQGTAFSSLTGGFRPAVRAGNSVNSSTATYVNFGQRPFAYTAPSGFKALCTTNLPTPAIGATSTTRANKYFDIRTIDGSNSDQSITDLNFAPDFLWAKSRSNVVSHGLYDTIRGGNKILFSDLTDAENTTTSNIVTFLSNGVTLQGGGSVINTGGRTYVDWFWKGGGTGVSNTQGTITSTVSANTTSGFSIVTWTGNSSNATIGHGLGVAPKMVIIKYRGTTDNWYVYHADAGTNKYLVLNATDAAATSTSIWQNTAPTSTVFSIGSGNNNSTIVAYCFAPVAGYSAFGSYTGNGSSDGVFVYTGFRPRYILIKRYTSSGTGWNIYDTSRSVSNVTDEILLANASDAEYGNESTLALDALSNGFKLRTTGSSINDSSQSYIYAAFAEVPTKFSLAR